MSIDRVTACEDMRLHFYAGWVAANFTAFGLTEPPTILYEGVKGDRPKFGPWGRFAIRHDASPMTGFGSGAVKIYTTSGTVYIQLFIPYNTVDNQNYTVLQMEEYLGKVAQDIFRGKRTTNGVIFRRTSAREIGEDNKEYQVNVLIDFEYLERS